MTKVEILGLAAGLPRTGLAPGAGDDTAAAPSLLEELFPGRIGAALAPADLLTASCPEYGRVYAGVFGSTAVVCGQDLLELTDLAAGLGATGAGRTIVRLQVNTAADSAALEIIGPDGGSARELMLVGEQGVIVDEGEHLDFERPFWAGELDPEGAFAAVNGPEMPFDVVDFGQEALRTLFGFTADADRRPGDLDARRVLLPGFTIAADVDGADGADDPADPVDPAQVLRDGDVPDVVADPFGPTSRLRAPAGDGAPAGGGGPRDAAAEAVDAAPAAGSWLTRLLARLFD